MQPSTLEQIKETYPDEWVLIGNPKIEGTNVVAGTVVLHSKDKREIAYSHINWRDNFESAITIFTGLQTTGRKFWL
jgi:hypothetical protein